jgi:uncharacterized protein
MHGSINSLKLINKKQLYISAFIGGPLIAGFVAAHNFWKLKQKGKAVQMVLYGLALTLLFEAFLSLLVLFIFHPLRMDKGIAISLVLFGAGQLLFTYIIFKLLKIKNLQGLVFPGHREYYSKWQIIPIILLSLSYLVVHIDIPILFAHFPNMILLFYVMPHFYFYNKIKHIFKSSKLVIITRWIIGVIACFLPIVFVLDGILPTKIMDLPSFLADYYIYTLLYLFLLICGVDLLAKLIHKFRLLPINFLQHPITKTGSLFLVLIGLVIILIEGNKRYNLIIVNTYNIKVQAKDAAIDSLKICFAADMHLNNNTSLNFIKDYVKLVKEINPDIVLYGGDMIERRRISKKKLEEFDKYLISIKPRYGKYIVSGNHDPIKLNGYNKESDMTYLDDTLVMVANSFYLMGLHYRSYEERPISKLKLLAKENLPIILLDHTPYQMDAASQNNIDIRLSGHTHYGQVWPINYIIELLYELPWGYKKINNTHFFVTSGIQGWGTPIRTTGQSEIMVIHVDFIK